MRRIFFLLAALMLCTAVQAGAADRPTVGPSLGLSIANFRGDDSEGLDSRIGVCLGGFIEYPITPIVSVQVEVLYAMKGATESGSGIDLTWSMDYIEVPVLVRLNMAPAGGVRPYLLAGPSIGLNVGAEWKVEGYGQSVALGIDDYVKGSDIGLIFGGGIGFPVGSRMLSLEGRYDMGFATIDDDLVRFLEEASGEDLGVDELDLKNGVFSLVVTLGL
jgi:hypothetical protein